MRERVIFLFLVFAFIFPNIFSQEERYVEINTSMGRMVVKLYNETPKHRDNFIKLAEQGYFDGLLFHRVINQFMIQGGDPNSRGASAGEMLGSGGPGYTIPAEFVPGLFHKKGVLAAARQGDMVNPRKESSGSQFYIVQGEVFTNEQLQAMVNSGRHRPFSDNEILSYTTTGGTPHLDGAYTVFGEVVEGLEVLDLIAAVPVDRYDRPVSDVIFNVKVIK